MSSLDDWRCYAIAFCMNLALLGGTIAAEPAAGGIALKLTTVLQNRVTVSSPATPLERNRDPTKVEPSQPPGEWRTGLTMRARLAEFRGSPRHQELQLEPEAEWNRGPLVLRFSAHFLQRFSNVIDREPPDTRNYSDESRPLASRDRSLELRDIYVQRWFGNHSVRLGKQQVVWGKVDGFQVLDVLNPRSFREFVLPETAQSRISIWAASADLDVAGTRVELMWSTDATRNHLAAVGTQFQLTAPRFNLGQSAPNDPRAALPVSLPTRHTFGLRLLRQFGGWELALVAVSGAEHEPVVVISDGELLQTYPHRRLIGASVETAVGRVALRGELAHRNNRQFNRVTNRGPDLFESDQLQAALGADISGPLNLFINAQFISDYLVDKHAGQIRPTVTRLVTLLLRRSFLAEQLVVDARAYYSLDDHDSLLRVGLSYSVTESSKFSLSVDRFSGDSEGIFGQFDDQDRVLIGWQGNW